MALTPRGEVSYNVQTRWTASYHLIVSQDVTKRGIGQSSAFSDGRKCKTDARPNRARGGRRYGLLHPPTVKQCEEAGLRVCLQTHRLEEHRTGLFGKEQFVYDHRGCYRCPAGERLDFRLRA